MSELADAVHQSRSRLTHTVARMEAENLVERVNCPTDRRGVWASLTAHGLELLETAAPSHVEAGPAQLRRGGSARRTTGGRPRVRRRSIALDETAQAPESRVRARRPSASLDAIMKQLLARSVSTALAGPVAELRHELRAGRASATVLDSSDLSRALYSSDASLYRVVPQAVAFPREHRRGDRGAGGRAYGRGAGDDPRSRHVLRGQRRRARADPGHLALPQPDPGDRPGGADRPGAARGGPVPAAGRGGTVRVALRA